VSVDGLSVMVVGAGATVSVTGTETLAAPVALIVTVALYVPAASELVDTVAVTPPLPVPDAGESVSQAALSVTDHASVPPPVLLILTVCEAGLPPPCCAEKERFVGLTPMAGGAGAVVTVKLTGTVTVVAPGALKLIDPV
jgi:hypothetical protein